MRMLSLCAKRLPVAAFARLLPGDTVVGEGRRGVLKAAGVERCDDRDEMRGKSCASVADALNEITSAQTSNSIYKTVFYVEDGCLSC